MYADYGRQEAPLISIGVIELLFTARENVFGGCMDWSKCPIVEVDPLKVSGTPILKGTRMPADFVVDNFLTGSPVEEIADNFELSLELVEEVLRFALQNALDKAA